MKQILNQLTILLCGFVLFSCAVVGDNVIVGDNVVPIEATLIDEIYRPYDSCIIKLIFKGKKQPFESIELRSIVDGKIKTSFNVPGKWRDSFILIECKKALNVFKSELITRNTIFPINLDEVVLKRSK